jgi:hypothetical protein
MDAFSIRFADNVKLTNCAVTWGTNTPAYFQNSVAVENVAGFKNNGFKGNTAAHPILEK